jgi:hypothetical protein
MILLAASVAQARAQEESDELAQSLGERSALELGREDAANLDATTLGKGEKQAVTSRVSRSSRFDAADRPGSTKLARNGGYVIVDKDTAQRDPRTGKRVFGGTNAGRLSGEGLPIQQPPKAAGWWGGGLFTSDKEKKEIKTSGIRNGGYIIVDKDVNQRDPRTGKRVFGGTNAGKLSGEGREIMEQPSLSNLWFGGRGKNTKAKAFSGGAFPVAAPKVVSRKPMMPRVRGGQFVLAAEDQKSGDAIFAAFALCMVLSTGVFAMLRTRPDREVLFSA